MAMTADTTLRKLDCKCKQQMAEWLEAEYVRPLRGYWDFGRGNGIGDAHAFLASLTCNCPPANDEPVLAKLREWLSEPTSPRSWGDYENGYADAIERTIEKLDALEAEQASVSHDERVAAFDAAWHLWAQNLGHEPRAQEDAAWKAGWDAAYVAETPQERERPDAS